MSDAIRVCCRYRPQNKVEKSRNAYIVIQVSDDHTACVVTHPEKAKQPKPLMFNFDCVFDWTSTQLEVFEFAAKHLVDQVFDGFNATIFAYGQTGAGKTYSMEGELGSPHRGIVPRTVETVFETIINADANMEYLLQVSYCEIYMEALRDLLNPSNGKMKIRENKHGVYVEGITEMYVRDAQEVIDLTVLGAGNRTVGGTNMNACSSRSHGVFMLKLTQTNTQTGSKRISKLKMIDLAGCEKVSKTGAKGKLLEEAKKINQSLSALGNVMGQLTSGGGHVSYRDSVLTRLLSDSLGGNCKTTLLIACSPSSYNADETITTCRFGVRAKKIKNKAKVNAEKTVAEYKMEVAAFKAQVMQLQSVIRALMVDLLNARKGELTEEDRGQSDEIMEAVDMNDIMSDGKKKKKKKKMAKGFVRPGQEPKPKKTKKKRKNAASEQKEDPSTPMNPGGEEADDNEDTDEDLKEEEKESVNMVSSSLIAEKDESIRVLEEKVLETEDHMRYLEKELIKAQAAAATNSGLADADPPPSLRRASILPAPMRPQSTRQSMLATSTPRHVTLTTPAMSLNTSSVPSSSSSPSHPHLQPSSLYTQTTPSHMISPLTQISIVESPATSSTNEFTFEMELGGIEGRQHAKETETVYKMPSHLADLDPVLLEQARRGLQQENYDLRRQMNVLLSDLDSARSMIERKNEHLQLQKVKFSDTEMECDRLLLQQHLYEENIELLEESAQRTQKEVEQSESEALDQQRQISQMKGKLLSQQQSFQKKISQIQEAERRRADEFVKQAGRELKRRQMNNANNNSGSRGGNLRQKTSSGYHQMRSSAAQNNKQLNRQRNAMEVQMQNLKEETFRALQKIKMEQLNLQQMLQKKIEEYIALRMEFAGKEEETQHLTHIIQTKNKQMQRVTRDLKDFGNLKIASDRVHQQEFQRAQKKIMELKKQLKKLQKLNTNRDRDQSQRKWEQFGYSAPKSDVTSSILKQQRQNIPIPLKGGNGSKKNTEPVASHTSNRMYSMTSEFFNQSNFSKHSSRVSTASNSMANVLGTRKISLRGGGGSAGGGSNHSKQSNNGRNGNAKNRISSQSHQSLYVIPRAQRNNSRLGSALTNSSGYHGRQTSRHSTNNNKASNRYPSASGNTRGMTGVASANDILNRYATNTSKTTRSARAVSNVSGYGNGGYTGSNSTSYW